MLYTRLRETFKTVFGMDGVLYATPGSLVVLGEQADALKGYALAAAVDRITAVMVRENGTDKARIYYMDTNELDEVSPSLPPTKAWTKSLYGVMMQLQRFGLPSKGFDAVVGGLLPNQACYSGYSALTTLGCLALNDINQLGLSRFDMVKLAQEAEAATSGRPVSVIHPFVALFGKADRLIRVNSYTLEYEYLSLPNPGLALLLLDASRQSSASLNDKAGDTVFCEQTQTALSEYTQHENAATQKAYEALLKQDKEGFGQALNDVQQALLDCQTNTVDEVTFLLATARHYQLLGARALGMGRAGCTLNVLNEASIPAFAELATVNYRREFDRDLKVYHVKLVDGASRLTF